MSSIGSIETVCKSTEGIIDISNLAIMWTELEVTASNVYEPKMTGNGNYIKRYYPNESKVTVGYGCYFGLLESSGNRKCWGDTRIDMYLCY